MEKELMLLTKSAMFHNYCVVGIDLADGKLYRLSSNDEKINYAMTEPLLRYANGEIANPLDVVKVNFIKKAERHIHQEDWLINEDIKLEKIRKGRITDIQAYVELDKPFIFGNTREFLRLEEVQPFGSSIQIAIVQNVRIKLIQSSFDGTIKSKMDFTYNDKSYTNFSITDIDYFSYKIPQGCQIDAAVVIFSLPEKPVGENFYYKFVAKIYPVILKKK